MKNIPYGRQEITDADIQAVVDVLRSDFLTQGPAVDQFEAEFCKFVGAPHSIAVTNGTAALHLAAMALNVGPGDRVLVTPNTFVASANCIRYCGAEVEFVDIDPDTFCIDLVALELKLKEKPPFYYKGIVCVDFAGFPVDFEKLRCLVKQFGLWIIEDACHALGAEFLTSDNIWVKAGAGQFADISVFSFHPVKHLATGEGGMITTADPQLAQKLRLLRSHGIVRDPNRLHENHGGWYYEMQELGYNYRISDILCSLGVSQLQRIETNLQSRQNIASKYFSELKDLPLVLPKVNEKIRHAFHLFVIQTDRRKELYDYLREKGIYTQVHYIPVHMQPYYVNRYGRNTLPVVENYYRHALSLPMFHALGDEDQGRVIDALRSFYQ